MSITASATSAPGDDLVRRGSARPRAASASSSASIVEQLGDPLAAGRRAPSVAADERAVARRRGAADPGQRAERLRGRDRVVGRARAQQVPGVAGDLGADLLAQRRGSPRRRASVARSARGPAAPRPSGSDQATSGASSAPPAISSEPPPMSKTASRPADQPNQRRTARKVSRASSSPGSTSIVDAGRVARRGRARRRSCAASRTAEVAKPSISSQPLSSATTTRVGDELGERLDARLGDRAVVVEVLGEPQRLLVGVRRQRGRAAVGVDHQQVPGVGADVEDAQAHGPNATGRGHAPP